jgi:NTE family protein
MMNLPASPLRKTCDIIIGVNLVPQIPVTDAELKTLVGIGGRCFDIAALNNIKPQLSVCDIVIEPMEISRYSRFSMSNIDKMYQIGYDETQRNIPLIQDQIQQQSC